MNDQDGHRIALDLESINKESIFDDDFKATPSNSEDHSNRQERQLFMDPLAMGSRIGEYEDINDELSQEPSREGKVNVPPSTNTSPTKPKDTCLADKFYEESEDDSYRAKREHHESFQSKIEIAIGSMTNF